MMTRIINALPGIFTAFLLLPACSERSIDGGAEAGSGVLSLSLTIDGMGTESVLRAGVDAENGEENIAALHLFFFEPSDNQTGRLVDRVKLIAPALHAATPIPAEGKAISASDAYCVIGVANADVYFPSGWEESDWTSEADFREKAIASLPVSIAPHDLLMHGIALKPAGNGAISMKLTRNAARFDVENKAPDYTLVSAQLSNICVFSSVTGDAVMNYSGSTARSGRSSTIDAAGSTVIKGRLYGFENQSSSPSQGDKTTTCLIVGLRNGGGVVYYRINVHPAGEVQHIRRNNVYAVSILHVNTSGYATAEEAFEGTAEGLLDYTINHWNLGDNGLIVSDSHSILALPVKSALIGKEASATNYKVTTFSTLPSPSPLAIQNSTLDDGLTVALTGNILTVTALGLPDDETERKGSVTLSFAGLEATLQVVQSIKTGAFVKLSYEAEWSALFGSAGNAHTKDIYVSASGPWTAIIVGNDGFAFDAGGTMRITGDKTGAFKIHSLSANPSETSTRSAYAIVSLDVDPVNHAGVVCVVQLPLRSIHITPVVQTITFAGNKSVVAPDPENNVFTFTVESKGIVIDDTDPQNPQEKEVWKEVTASVAQTSDRFGYELVRKNTGVPDEIIYTLKVYTKGANISASNYTGTLTLSDTEGEMVIDLIQRPSGLTVVTGEPTVTTPMGGETGAFYLSLDTQTLCTAQLSVQTVGGEIFNHPVRLVYADTGSEVGASDNMLAGTLLKVVFPKIYFPNRGAEIRVTVTFTTPENATASRTFIQNKLMANGLNVWTTSRDHWGSVWSSGLNDFGGFNDRFIPNMSSLAQFAGGSRYALTEAGSSSDFGHSMNPNSTTWMHLSNNTLTNTSDWIYAENFLRNKDALVVFQAGDGGSSPRWNLINHSPLVSLGYTFSDYNSRLSGYVSLNTSASASKIYQFIAAKGRRKINNASLEFYHDHVNTAAISVPSGAVVLLQYANGEACLVIDPKNRLVYHGEEMNFDIRSLSGTQQREGQSEFIYNYIDYLVHAAMYGSHFTDMLRDDLDVPPPWDAAWGMNAWIVP